MWAMTAKPHFILDADGWSSHARHVRSPNFDARPPATEVDLIVLHSISLPPGNYTGEAVERLFTNQLDPDEHPYYERVRGLKLSAHFVIRRNGEVLQFVSCDARAWHAGTSSWGGRERCNDFSIGIEIEGLEGEGFEVAQYEALLPLLESLCARYPIRAIVGHEHVAPGRKADPGPGFQWSRLGEMAQRRGLTLPAQPKTATVRRWNPTPLERREARIEELKAGFDAPYSED